MEKWNELTSGPAVVEFFKNLFEHLGVLVTDTNEAFTCHHRGDKIELKEGVNEEAVDYTVEIESFQVDRLVAHTLGWRRLGCRSCRRPHLDSR